MGDPDKAAFASLLDSLHALGAVPEAEFDSLAAGHLRVGGHPDPSAKWAEFKELMLEHGRALRFDLGALDCPQRNPGGGRMRVLVVAAVVVVGAGVGCGKRDAEGQLVSQELTWRQQ